MVKRFFYLIVVIVLFYMCNGYPHNEYLHIHKDTSIASRIESIKMYKGTSLIKLNDERKFLISAITYLDTNKTKFSSLDAQAAIGDSITKQTNSNVLILHKNGGGKMKFEITFYE